MTSRLTDVAPSGLFDDRHGKLQDNHRKNTDNGRISCSSSQGPLIGNPHGDSSASYHEAGVQDNLLADNYSGEEAIGNTLKVCGTPESVVIW